MQAVYYRDAEGTEPVLEAIRELGPTASAAVRAQINVLNRLGNEDPPLPFPLSSQVEGDLRELRCHHGRRLYRVLYRRSDRLFVLLHMFEKSTAKVPTGAIHVARSRWADYRARMDISPRTPPRAVGHDAP